MRRAWLVGGGLVAMAASAGPALWMSADLVRRNPLGKYVDAGGAWSVQLYLQFVQWWLPIAMPVGLLVLACLLLNRRAD